MPPEDFTYAKGAENVRGGAVKICRTIETERKKKKKRITCLTAASKCNFLCKYEERRRSLPKVQLAIIVTRTKTVVLGTRPGIVVTRLWLCVSLVLRIFSISNKLEPSRDQQCPSLDNVDDDG